MNLSLSAQLAFAIQSVQVASMELEGTDPHFLISKSCSPWLCGFVFPRTGAREACLEARKVKPPLLGHQPPPVPKSVSPLSGAWWGGGAQISHVPKYGFCFCFPFLHMGHRERRRGAKPLKSVSCPIAQHFTSPQAQPHSRGAPLSQAATFSLL